MHHFAPPAPVREVLITEQLYSRPASPPDYSREKLAMQRLAEAMADQPSEILPRLVRLAMEFCDADSAGVSVLDPGGSVFRWLGLAGVLSVFEGATTPRNASPCGVCLDHRTPILMRHPERAYDWIRDAGICVPEVLLVPLEVRGTEPLGTLWVVAREGQHFDGGNARALSDLAAFAGVALRMIQNEDKLKKALRAQETLAQEMSHRVKNFFAIADGLIRMTSVSAGSKEDLVDTLRGRIHAFAEAHALVKRTPAEEHIDGVALADVVERILRPYGPSASVAGPDVLLIEQAISDFALVFHELATNAAKYGSLSQPGGSVAIAWDRDDRTLAIDWHELGATGIAPPARKGFGSTLMEAAISRWGGAIDFAWHPQGLRARITASLGRVSRS